MYRQQTTAFKINVSFGFFLRHMETGEMGRSFADQCDVLCQQSVWPPDWYQSRPSKPYFEEQSCRCLSWWIPWTSWGQPMLLPMFSSTSWNFTCQSLKSPNQDVLQTVSTTARHDPCRLQGCDVGWFGGIGAGIQLERVCVWRKLAMIILLLLLRRKQVLFDYSA